MITFDTARSDAIRAALIADVARTSPRPKRSRRAIAAAAVASVVAGAGISAVAFGTNGDPSPFSEGVGEVVTQFPGGFLEQLASLPGYGGGGPGERSGDIELVWFGTPGPEAQAILADAEADGYVVRIVPAAHDPATMNDDMNALAGALKDAGIEVWGFGPSRYFDAIELNGPALSADAATQARAREISMDTIGPDYELVFVPNREFRTYQAPVRSR